MKVITEEKKFKDSDQSSRTLFIVETVKLYIVETCFQTKLLKGQRS